MKKVSQHLGEIIVALAAVALLVLAVTAFRGDISNFFDSIISKEQAIGDKVLGSMEGLAGGDFMPGPEDLESKYEFEYYPTLQDAIQGSNGSAEKTNERFGVYTDAGMTHVVLLDNVDLDSRIEVSRDITINLNGKTMSCSDSVAVNITAGNVFVDGSSSGSKIVSSGKIFGVDGGSLEVNGGTYTSNTSGAGTSSNSAGAITVDSGSTLIFNNAKVYANDNANGTVSCILGSAGSTIVASGSTIVSTSNGSLETAGVRSLGDVTLTNCHIEAKSDYTANAAGTAYASNSRGVYCEGKLELNNCYVWGAHAGVTCKGELAINGGTYEGYGHGGLYFSGSTANIKNAKLYWAEMKEGCIADSVAGTNGAGFYVGGASNITMYMDNCDVYGTLYGVVIRSSGGEKNNNLYVSNSTVEGSRFAFRIQKSNSTLLVHTGVGNTFSSPVIDYSISLVETEDSYA